MTRHDTTCESACRASHVLSVSRDFPPLSPRFLPFAHLVLGHELCGHAHRISNGCSKHTASDAISQHSRRETRPRAASVLVRSSSGGGGGGGGRGGGCSDHSMRQELWLEQCAHEGEWMCEEDVMCISDVMWVSHRGRFRLTPRTKVFQDSIRALCESHGMT